MTYVAIANLKGGVGKSTTTMMLAEALATFHDRSVLVVDLDPQSNSSFMFLSRGGAEANEQDGRTFMHFMDALGAESSINIAKFVRPKASDLTSLAEANGRGQVALISSSPRMWFSEAKFEKGSYRKGLEPDVILAQATRHYLDKIRGTYDVVLFDCPPGFSTLSRAGIRMADIVVSPTISDDISARSLKDFVEVGLREIIGGNRPHHVVVTRHVQHIVNDIMVDRLRRDYKMIGSPVKYSVDIMRACERIRHDSYRNFREKYGSQHNSVRDLGAAFVRTLDSYGGRS
jgi:chromosome partitioning protein